MSMREYPESGYFVPVEKLLDLLPTEKSIDIINAMDDNLENAEELLNEALPNNFPSAHLFYPSDTDTINEEMDCSALGMYAIFDESDLYKKTPTQSHQAMIDLGVVPEFASWSVWC